MAGEWSYRARGLSYPFLDVEPQGPDISLSSRFVLIPLLFVPFYLVPSTMFRPKEKKSARCYRFESPSDSGFIAQNPAFYRLYVTWSICHFPWTCYIILPFFQGCSSSLTVIPWDSRSFVLSSRHPVVPILVICSIL